MNCNFCNKPFTDDDYVGLDKASGVPRWLCVSCKKQYQRRKNLKVRYNITEDELDLMLEFYEHKCAICESEIQGSAVYIDHCHNTNAIRGALCKKCNSAIGYLKDDIYILERAVRYLKHGKENFRERYQAAKSQGITTWRTQQERNEQEQKLKEL